MGHGVLVEETRYARARRLAREAEERRAEAEVRERLTMGRAQAAERALGLCRDELHGATVAGQRKDERIADLERDAAAAPFLAEMLVHALAEAVVRQPVDDEGPAEIAPPA